MGAKLTEKIDKVLSFLFKVATSPPKPPGALFADFPPIEGRMMSISRPYFIGNFEVPLQRGRGIICLLYTSDAADE